MPGNPLRDVQLQTQSFENKETDDIDFRIITSILNKARRDSLDGFDNRICKTEGLERRYQKEGTPPTVRNATMLYLPRKYLIHKASVH